MKIKELSKRPTLVQKPKLHKKYLQFGQLISELNKEEYPDETVTSINELIEPVNAFSGSEKELNKVLKKAQSALIALLEQKLKIVVKNHYRNLYLAIGIALGVSFGAALGPITENYALSGIGLPFGMAIGIAIGTNMDKKAREEGRQLNIELQ